MGVGQDEAGGVDDDAGATAPLFGEEAGAMGVVGIDFDTGVDVDLDDRGASGINELFDSGAIFGESGGVFAGGSLRVER